MGTSQPDLTEFLPERAPFRCVVARALDALGQQDRINFQAALDAPTRGRAGVPDRKIAERLKARGLPGSDTSVEKHRKGLCPCE